MTYFLLMATFVLEYVRLGVYFPIIDSTKLNVIVPLATFLLSLVVKSRIEHEVVWKHSNTKWFIFLLFLMLLSLLVIGGEKNSDNFQGVLGYVFLYYAIVRLSDTKKKLKGVILILAICHVITIFISPEVILDPSTRSYLYGAPFLSDGNDFGLSATIMFPLILYLFLDAKSKTYKLFAMVLAILCLLAIIGTQSRGASLGMAAVLVFLWLKSKRKILGVFAIGILLFVAILFAAPQYFDRMATLADPSSEGSAKGRLDAWTRAFFLAVGSPLLGVGVGNFGLYNHNQTAHSIYFIALGELGFPGMFFIIMYVVLNLKKIQSYINKTSNEGEFADNSYQKLFICMFCAMLGLSVSGAFLSCLYYPHIFVLGGMVVASQRLFELDVVEKKKNINEENDSDEIIATEKPRNPYGY